MKNIKSKYTEINSDTITPIGTFLNLRDSFAGVSLFESSDYRNKQNSKSFVCVDPLVTLSVEKAELKCRENGKLVLQEEIRNAEILQECIDSYDFEEEEVKSYNGFFGLIGYDAIPLFEDIEISGDSSVPDVLLNCYRYVLVFDNFKNVATLIQNSFSGEDFNLEQLAVEIFKGKKHQHKFEIAGEETSNETNDSFAEKVKLAKEHIKRGDVFQLVLSRKFKQRFSGDEFEVYRQLRMLNPSPYMFYFDLNKAVVFGASPEAQFKLTDGLAEIHPIAGTVKRTGDVLTDHQLSEKLAKDAKENAEHTMLVDLARNDLNRSCKSVEVVKLKEIQEFSHVIHMVSLVQGRIDANSPLEAFGGAFPAGTLSGAPKYRAMELIEEYESEARKYYGGAVGLINARGDINMAIVIRSCLAQNQTLEYQAGAGVVLDSSEKGETQEVENKIGAIRKAIQKANNK